VAKSKKFGEAFVEIRARLDKLQQNLNTAKMQVSSASRKMSARLSAVGKSLSRGIRAAVPVIRNAALAATAAMAGFVAVMVKAVKAASAQEKADVELAESLKLAGDNTRGAIQDMKQFASAMQAVTTVGDEALQPIIALGANLSGLTRGPLKTLTIAAIGLSRRLGVDLKAAMLLLARAVKGEFTTFSRYGIKLDETATAQEKLNQVMGFGIEGFKLAKAEATTLSGQMEQLKNALGDVFEGVGEGAIKTGGLVSGLTDLKEVMIGIAAVGDQLLSILGPFTNIPGFGLAIGDTIEDFRKAGREHDRISKETARRAEQAAQKRGIVVDAASVEKKRAQDAEKAASEEFKRLSAMEKETQEVRSQFREYQRQRAMKRVVDQEDEIRRRREKREHQLTFAQTAIDSARSMSQRLSAMLTSGQIFRGAATGTFARLSVPAMSTMPLGVSPEKELVRLARQARADDKERNRLLENFSLVSP